MEAAEFMGNWQLYFASLEKIGKVKLPVSFAWVVERRFGGMSSAKPTVRGG